MIVIVFKGCASRVTRTESSHPYLILVSLPEQPGTIRDHTGTLFTLLLPVSTYLLFIIFIFIVPEVRVVPGV